MDRKYSLVLHTDIGERIGKMFVSISGGKLSGKLYFFGKEHKFKGTIDSSGSCSIRGTLATLKNHINYVATGYINASDLLLTLKYKANEYLLKGCPLKA